MIDYLAKCIKEEFAYLLENESASCNTKTLDELGFIDDDIQELIALTEDVCGFCLTGSEARKHFDPTTATIDSICLAMDYIYQNEVS